MAGSATRGNGDLMDNAGDTNERAARRAARRDADAPPGGPWRLLGTLMERFLLGVIVVNLLRRAFARRERRRP
ncbi:hypothetical protein Nocox_23885 [Nonomuraea coxensis DSM 45129]|uniref:Uncharacterized protein n=2 Tax=Nonomuraea coxensis TaxID=404386 RepID=A0ABX8U3Y6_9ACTN|nr:hypothetical protein Nocox_23885 [Nonomuraea coxensis DSM 45129]